MYQLSDLLSDMFPSAPGDAAPFIRTLAKRQDRKNNRARTVIIMAAGAPPPEHSALFVRNHRLHAAPDGSLWDWNITCPARHVDIYRSHGKCPDLPKAGNNCAWVSVDEMDTPEAPAKVLEAEREWVHKLWLEAKHYYRSTAHLQAVKEADEQFAATGEEIRVHPPQKYEVVSGLADENWPDDQTIDNYIRRWRGDLSTIGSWDSPWQLTSDQAAKVGNLMLSTEHLYAGVREEHGRWQYYRGLGSHLVIEGTADSPEEAEVMARAHLFTAWLARVQEIRSARLGDLSWGLALRSPLWWDMANPQAEY